MARKKVCGFVAFDEKNRKNYERFIASLRKFHSEEELPVLIWDEHKIKSYADPYFFYRQKPIIAKQLLKDYELVIGFDVDQIICGDLNHIIDQTDYDIAAPLNWNKVDEIQFGPVSVDCIPPAMYLNCGIVAMRSREFVEKWFRLCQNGLIFGSHQYREQDIMNLMALYLDFRVMNLDSHDTWNGLISKARWGDLILVDGKLVCPPFSDGFPAKPMTVKVIHFGGGNNPQDKFQAIYTRFNPKVTEFLQGLIK